MSYKRQMWTSGYEYRARCPKCGTFLSYFDRDLQYRAWYANGFVYCPTCREPIRHNEMYAVNEDGTPVYKTQAEANQALVIGYNKALGSPVQTVNPQPVSAGNVPTEGVGYCPECGAKFEKGTTHFCSNCGTKLD